MASLGTEGPRIIHSGASGSLLNAGNIRFVDTPDFATGPLPAAEPTVKEFRDEALGQAAALDYYRTTQGVTWTYLSPPPGNFAPGVRRGTYRTGTEHPVLDEHGNFGISSKTMQLLSSTRLKSPGT